MTSPPAPPIARPASTLLLVRDATTGIEVLMVKRSQGSSFMGGVYVFPGGGVDEQDSDPVLAERILGRTDEVASRRLGLRSGGLAYWISAVRELFEESGMLLARWPDGSQVALVGDVATRFADHRAAVNRGARRFADVVVAEDLRIDLGPIHHHAHWVTPASAPKRFDTFFFVAAAPPDQIPAHDAGETVAVEWVTPADALDRHRRGEIEMVVPTIRNLRYIERFATVEALLADAAAIDEIPSILPRMIMGEEGPTLLVPGDEGYEGGPDPLFDPSLFPRAARHRAAVENPPDG